MSDRPPTKPPELGSPERPDPTTLGLSAAAAAGGKPYLGNAETVAALVGEFMDGVIQRAVAAGQGQTTGQAAAAADQAAAKALIEIIAGRDARFTPMRSWNAAKEGGLRSWLRARLAEVVSPEMLAKEPDGPLEAVAAYLLAGTYDILRAWDEPEDALRERVAGLREEVTNLLLGVGPEAEPAAEAAGR